MLRRFQNLRVTVVGDFFLDAYFDCDPALDEPSLETGLNAYQVVRTRRQAGAAGTVVANLAALGCGHIDTVGFRGDDGEGYELERALVGIGADTTHLVCSPSRSTPTYGKPCLVTAEASNRWRVTRELERLDIKNRRPTPRALQGDLVDRLTSCLETTHAVVVVDQVSELDCGVLTRSVRAAVNRAARQRPDIVFLADSREQIAHFSQVSIKPNLAEAQAATDRRGNSITAAGRILYQLQGPRRRPCFCTLSTRGMLVADDAGLHHAAAFPVEGLTDPVGAGDSATAALTCVLGAGGTATEAALTANLVASITVQQIGTTGTASKHQVLRRHREVDAS